MLDSQGKLIGVNTMILSPSGASSGVGFAVPADTVRRVVNQIIRHGRVIKPSLGVNCAADQQARQLGLGGVLVLSVVPGSGADEAGLLGTEEAELAEDILADFVVFRQSIAPLPITAEVIRASPAACALHTMLGLAEAFAVDRKFARQLRRQVLR